MEKSSNHTSDAESQDFIVSEANSEGVHEITSVRRSAGEQTAASNRTLASKEIARLSNDLAAVNNNDNDTTQSMPPVGPSYETSAQPQTPDNYAGLFSDSADQNTATMPFGGIFSGETETAGDSGNLPPEAGQPGGGPSRRRGPRRLAGVAAIAVLFVGAWGVNQLEANQSSKDNPSNSQLDRPANGSKLSDQHGTKEENLAIQLNKHRANDVTVRPKPSPKTAIAKPKKAKSTMAPSQTAAPNKATPTPAPSEPAEQPTPTQASTPTPAPTESAPSPQPPELTFAWASQLEPVIIRDKLNELEASHPKLAELMQSDDWQDQLDLDHYSAKTIQDYQAAYAAAYANPTAAAIMGEPRFVSQENLGDLSRDVSSANDLLVNNTDNMLAAAHEVAEQTDISTVDLAYLGGDLRQSKQHDADHGAQLGQAQASAVLAVVNTKLGDGTPVEVALVWSSYGPDEDEGDDNWPQYVRAYLPIAVSQSAAPGLDTDSAIPVAVAERRLSKPNDDNDDSEISGDPTDDASVASTPSPSFSPDLPSPSPSQSPEDDPTDPLSTLLAPVSSAYKEFRSTIGSLAADRPELPGHSWRRDEHGHHDEHWNH